MKNGFVVLLSTVIAACNYGNQKTDKARDDKSQIEILNKKWSELYNQKDAKQLSELYTENAVRQPDSFATTVNRQVLEEEYTKEFNKAWQAKAKDSLITDDIIIDHDYAFSRGRDFTITESNGVRNIVPSKWMAVYHRENDGKWKFFWSTYNREP